MSWRLHLVLVAAALLGAGIWGGVRAARAPESDAAPRAGATDDRLDRDVQIRVWGTALEADPGSALVLGQLAALHLQRSRETGAWNDLLRAESYARVSLAKRTQRNGATAATLVAALVAQHRFREAAAVATALVAREPDVLEYRAMLAEVAMERGDYVVAEREFGKVWPLRSHLSVAPRLARWRELTGDQASARHLLEGARDEAWERRDLPREVKAWFALRLGEFERRSGRPRRAELALRGGLALAPDDPRLLLAMARLHADARDPDGAIAWGERAIGERLDPEVLLLLADAYAAKGDAGPASRARTAFDAAVSAVEGPFHRQWSLALLDRGEQVPVLLERARAELTERQDIHAYDLLAWALFKSGRIDDAAIAIDSALRLGTRDPQLEAHAAAIRQAASRRDVANVPARRD